MNEIPEEDVRGKSEIPEESREKKKRDMCSLKSCDPWSFKPSPCKCADLSTLTASSHQPFPYDSLAIEILMSASGTFAVLNPLHCHCKTEFC